MGLEPMTLWYRCSALTNWAIKPTESWADHPPFANTISPRRWRTKLELIRINLVVENKGMWIQLHIETFIYIWTTGEVINDHDHRGNKEPDKIDV